MSRFIHGRGFIWTTYDPAGWLTAAVQETLQKLLQEEPVKLRWVRMVQPGDVLDISPAVGLAIWHVTTVEETQPVCDALSGASRQNEAPVRVVYLQPSMADWLPILLEAGAQIVVSQLTFLQDALVRAAHRAPRSRHGFHPLTAGLAQRLPWPEVGDDTER